jgi:hypothetical protein
MEVQVHRSLRFGIAGALIAVGLGVSTPPAHTQARPGGELTLPLRMSAFAVNMGGTLRTTAVWDIRVTRWTTPDERTKLLGQVVENDTDDLLKALLKMPSHGRISVPGHRGPDPHKVVLGWTLHFAHHAPLPDGGHRLVLATDRYVTFQEARADPRTMDYPFTLLEIRLDKNGEGAGKASVATKINFDRKKNTMELENYGIEPVRLNQIKIEK